MTKLRLSAGGVTAALLAAPLLFLASAPGYSQALDEITVTARKTAESLQEVPLSITALGEGDIERLNLTDLSDITQQDTSVQFDEGFTPSDTRISIRGLSPTRGRPNAATLVDGIDLTSEAVSNAGGSTLINPRLVDVQRIEIIKGPQSALFGRSAFAGAIQYITKDPSDTLEGDLFVNGTTERDAEIRGSLSIPLTDTLGALINGYGWDSRGSYKNIATNDYVGGGSGAGVSLTLKWEPTDNLGFKWRTEYSDDQFDPAAQVLLNNLNSIVDLNDVTPGASACNLTPDADGVLRAGPLLDGSCEQRYVNRNNLPPLLAAGNETRSLNLFFENPGALDALGRPKDLGQFDPSKSSNLDQYNKQIVSFYQGELPGADSLQVALNPNYRNGPGAINPVNAVDYFGTKKEVFRTALKIDWAITDDLEFLSNSSYLDSTVNVQTDIGKFYIDECSANIAELYQRPDPMGVYGSYAEAIINETSYGPDDLARFAPCTLMQPDGINDASNQFIQDDETKTTQFSQEFRLAWQANDSMNLVGGVQLWKEKVELVDLNSTAIGGGPGCYLFFGNPAGADVSQDPGASAFVQLDPLQDQCGNTSIIMAYYMNDLYQARLADPSTQLRQTDHYSAYSSFDWDVTERFTMRVEARYVIEDNQVTGNVVTPCVSGERAFSPESGIPSGCSLGAPTDRLQVANGGQALGPSAVVLCGSTGRCDRLGLASVSGSPYYAGNNPNGPLFNEFTGDSWWAFGFAPNPGTLETLNRRDRFWAPKATVEYLWNDDIMTYLSWSRGIKPGGFSLLTSGAFGLDANLDNVFDEIEFEPERLDVWEVGYKTTLMDGRVRLNGSFFFQDFKDKQVTVQKVTEGTTGTEVVNISGSEVRGAEVDLTWQVTENVRAQVGYTFLDSEYTDYTVITPSPGDIARINAGKPSEVCSELALIPGSEGARVGCVMSFNGNELERVPRHAWLVNLNYTNSLFDTGLEWFSEVNYRYQDSRWVEAWNIVQFPSYSLTDVRFGILADRWDVQLYVTNIFDDDTPISGGANPGIATGSFGFGLAPPPFPGVNAGPKLPSDAYINMPNPRIFGVNAKFRFGG